MTRNNDEEKDRAALIIIPIIAGAGALWYFLRRRVVADPDKAVLVGNVTDAETGDPIQGIDVACNGCTDKTDASGDYKIINIVPGTYNVMFTDPLERYAPKVV